MTKLDRVLRLGARAAAFAITVPIIIAWWGGGALYAAYKVVTVGEPPRA